MHPPKSIVAMEIHDAYFLSVKYILGSEQIFPIALFSWVKFELCPDMCDEMVLLGQPHNIYKIYFFRVPNQLDKHNKLKQKAM